MNKFVKFVGQSDLYLQPIPYNMFKGKGLGSKVWYKDRIFTVYDIITSAKSNSKVYILNP